MPNFIHLHLHTEYSLVDGLVGIKPLMKALAAQKMPAAAMTDHCNLFAMVKFYKAALAAGIKPIFGADLKIQDEKDPKKNHRLILLCQNFSGYKNLTRLLSKAYLEGQGVEGPIIQKDWLKNLSEGLIALSGGIDGDIGQALISNQPALAEQLLQTWSQIFPERFYLELSRVGQENEEFYIHHALPLAHKMQIPVVATNKVRFLQKEDFEAHEARVCVHGGWVLDDSRRSHDYTEQQYLRTPEEMEALFADIPSALENTVAIAQRCNVELTLGKSFLPNFPVPEGMTIDSFFQQEAEQGLEKRFKAFLQQNPEFEKEKSNYINRLQMEVKVIQGMGFPGYFLIVADFIRWAKQQNIFVGPGRGSGAGSLVAYALEITDLDPMAHDLLFERFLNPERVSMADFDIDFCMEGRDRVIEYVAHKYGRDSVAQIITYGTMAARAVVRDVGRVLGFPYGFVDKIAKLIPFELGMTLEKALNDEPLLLERYQQEEEVKTLIDLGMKLEGVPRNVGKHAGGVVIAPSVLTDFTPLYCEPDGENRVTQFDKDDVEAVGLVKFDFLGLRTLTIMDWALQAIRERNGVSIDLNHLPLEDTPTFDLLKSCQTTAVFQLESRGMKELIKRLQPDHFDEIVALVALFRPGPLQSGMVDDFIDRKHGRALVEFPHPLLEPILRPTYGVILYQEQVMQIAQILAGYTLGGADLLRRAMGKKKPEEMAKQREIFVKGAQEKGVETEVANSIFDLMEKFADYGFNKSHSAAYALLAYQTAWLKTYYPAEFMSAVLSSDMDHTDKVVRFIEDSNKMGLKVLPPSLNESFLRFTVNSKGEIVYGLGAIKGVGSAALESILQTRLESGPFQNLFEFYQRVDTRKVNRKVLEALIRSGAMDDFQVDRAVLLASLESALQTAEQKNRAKNVGQMDLFGEAVLESPTQEVCYQKAEPLPDAARLQGEKETLGWYLSGHPIMQYENELQQFTSASLLELKPDSNKTVLIAGYITAVRLIQTKSGSRMATLTLEDRAGRIDVTIFPKLFETCRPFLIKDQLLIVEGEVELDEFTESNKLNARSAYDLAHMRTQFVDKLQLHLYANLPASFVPDLKKILTPFQGGTCPIFIQFDQGEGSAEFTLGEEWKIQLTSELIMNLFQFCGKENVTLHYNTSKIASAGEKNAPRKWPRKQSVVTADE